MEPRLPSSKKWTLFPADFTKQIIQVLSESFADQAKKGKFLAEGRIFKEEILVRLGFLENGRITQANAEVSVEYNPKKENVKHIIDLAIDCAGSILENYFTNPDEDFPRQWKSFNVEKKEVFIQFSTHNTELEAQADEILKEDNSDLVQGEDFEQEAQAMKKVFSDD